MAEPAETREQIAERVRREFALGIPVYVAGERRTLSPGSPEYEGTVAELVRAVEEQRAGTNDRGITGVLLAEAPPGSVQIRCDAGDVG
jgi:hypothetical protein